MKKIVLVAILTILLASLVAATSGCRCGMPGDPGVLIGFTAKNGTTNNVTFYNDTSPQKGKEFSLWALKTIGTNKVPITGLNVIVELNSLELSKLTTDSNGYVAFSVDDPGEYVITGGDANMVFEIKGEEKPQPVVNNTTRANDSAKPAGNHSSSLNESPIKKPEIQSPVQDPTSTTNGSNDLWLYVAIILIAIVMLFSIKTGAYKKGCFLHRKSSVISGKRRG